MRIDKKDPNKEYKNFWDWLLWHDSHILLFMGTFLPIGYYPYHKNTREA